MVAAEFFAGMGLMRAALDRCGIDTVFANDIDKHKASLYKENWGDGELRVCDIHDLRGCDVPNVDLATASFPCVDVSLAGYRAGLKGARSGTVYEFCRLLDEMCEPPAVVILENVPGFLSVNEGRDYRALVAQLGQSGYCTTHICVDAASFVPQSRLRVFLLGFRDLEGAPMLPPPPGPRPDLRLDDVIDDGLEWWNERRLGAFLSSLSELQTERVNAYRRQCAVSHHGAYRRTRRGRAVWGGAPGRDCRHVANDPRRFWPPGGVAGRPRRGGRALDGRCRVRGSPRRTRHQVRLGISAAGHVRLRRRGLRASGGMACEELRAAGDRGR